LGLRIIKNVLIFIFLSLLISIKLFATEAVTEKKEIKEKDFNAGEMIIEHVSDAYYWHILSFGKTEISIPLPVILIDKGKLITFCSSRFEHGEMSYLGYKIESEGKNKSKVVPVKIDGTTDTERKIPFDLSITKNVLSLFINMLILCFIFISIARSYARNVNKAPKGLQSFLEPVILFIRDDLAKPAIGEKKYEKYMPYLLTVFFFIFLSNIFGLLPIFPGGTNLTGNLAVTGTLAVFTFIITTFSANKNYWKHIINTPGVPWWLKFPIPMMPLIELLGVFTKPFVLMIRLFANITAGHMVTLCFISLIFIFAKLSPSIGYAVSPVSVAFVIFMNLLDLLVAFLQAYVFTMLSALYFGLATEEHH
jgi:F-type H+-transporting ATPase subunit a